MNPPPDPFATATPQTFARGKVLVDASDQPADAWLIVDGTVRQFDILPNGSEFSLNIYKPGSVLALTWLFGNVTNHHYFETMNDVTVRRISAETYRSYIKDHPDEAFAILERLSRGLDGMFSRITANSQNDAVARILNEVRIESARFSSDTDSQKLTSTMLARRTGLARETVSRTVSKLLENGTLERTALHGLRIKHEP